MQYIQLETRTCINCLNPIKRNTKSGTTRITPKQYKNAKYCSMECSGIQHSLRMKGKNNPNYIHGNSNILSILRGSTEYKKWRMDVFKRDKFKCVMCFKKSGNLNADHIKPFCLFPKYRFDINNGRTLCVPCHRSLGGHLIRTNKKVYAV